MTDFLVQLILPDEEKLMLIFSGIHGEHTDYESATSEPFTKARFSKNFDSCLLMT
jgi:hypothetical protein